MPLQSTSGAASYDAFGGGAAAKVNYIEDFFQSYLRTGTGASATITTGLDGSTKETLVWTKSRSAATNHKLTDNVRGATKALSSNTTGAEATDSQGLTAFSATGYTIGTNTDYNNSGATYVDWQWVAQPKFFDVVTWTDDGTSPRTISHNLGSVPGCIIVKAVTDTSAWFVYHRSAAASGFTPEQCNLKLNLTNAVTDNATIWNNTAPTSTVFTVGSNFQGGGITYVAYLFAHDAGGFGLTGTDNVISCGSFSASMGSLVNIGFEPQFVLIKKTTNVDDWLLFDNMRGLTMGDDSLLNPNTSGAENNSPGNDYINPQPTGFTQIGFGSGTFIYIAIRRGPMKVPTSGTSVYATDTLGGSSGGTAVPAYRSPFPVDFAFEKRTNASDNWVVNDRLRGINSLNFNLTAAEALYDAEYKMDFMNGWVNYTGSNSQYRSWMFRRSPSVFDEVCYTGTGADPQTVSHNLGVAPELMIFKARAVGAGWRVWGGNMAITEYLALNEDSAVVTGPAFFGGTLPTATSFYVGSGLSVSARTHVAYLFATAAGVSKVFSYTGNGSSQTINCGFTGGARWILIKRTDSTGDWYVWDTARGIVSGNDPHLSLNSTAAEVTSNDTIDTDSTGFVVNQVSATNVNVSSATYIGLAIA